MARSSPQEIGDVLREQSRGLLQRWNNHSSKVKHSFTRVFLWIHGASWLDQYVGEDEVADICHKAQLHAHGGCTPGGRTPGDFVALLKFCAKRKDLHKGVQIHHDVLEMGFLVRCSDALITMYAKCGEFARAEELLNQHSSRDVYSWTDVISAYAQSGQARAALHVFERMQREGLLPDAVTFACVLKACGSLKEIQKGEQIHGEIARLGLMKINVVIGNALVDMYAKCAALMKAQKVLEGLPVRDTITWSTIILAYVQEGLGEEALQCFHWMQHEGVSPDAVTFACVLKACGIARASDVGEQIHTEIAKQGLLRKDTVLGIALIDMYAKCGSFQEAKQLIKDLPVQSVALWSALIAGYVEHDENAEALNACQEMRCKGLQPNEITYISTLKACGSIGALSVGKEIHHEIDVRRLLVHNAALGTALVDMYAKCGALEVAQHVCDELPTPSVESWNAVMAGYIQEGKPEQVLACFKRMESKHLWPTAVTFLCVLKALGDIGAGDRGEKVHDEIARLGLLEQDILLGNALVDMYAKCGALSRARQVLEELPARDAVSWNSLIAGYVQQGQGEKALQCLKHMCCDGNIPNEMTFSSILKACGMVKAIDEGKAVHNEICRFGMLANNHLLGTALVDMYAKCGVLTKARQVLEELQVQNTCSWTALIGGYVEQGKAGQAIIIYEQMKSKGISPDGVTFLCALKACSTIGTDSKGEQIHMDIARQGFLSYEVTVGNALVDMYAKCGAFAKAQRVFEELPCQSVVSWSALIEGYALYAHGEQALKCFEQMQHMGVRPDCVTFLSILKACTSIGAAERGEQVYDEIIRQGLFGNDSVLGNALVAMYAKCGDFARAQRVLEELPIQDFVSWNTLITGYARHGQREQVLKCLDMMRQKGISPDAVTFLCILKACGSTGQANDAQMYFSNMKREFGINPNVKHYTCLVDVLGRVGQLAAAIKLIQKMDLFDHSIVLWSSVLGACEKWGDVNVGEWAFEQALQEDKKDPAAYILMANIYAAAGMQGHVKSVEELRIKNAAWGSCRTIPELSG